MILLILLSVLSGAFTYPGQQKQGEQQYQVPWFVVFEEKGTQHNQTQFIRAQKEAIDVWKQLHSKMPVYAWQNEGNTLYRIIPVHNFASIDTLYRKMERISEIVNAGRMDVNEQRVHPSTISGTVMMWMPELSNQRETEFSINPNEPYTQWMFIYLLSGQEEAAGQSLKNFRDYYIDKKLDYPWHTFRVLLGNDTPVLIGMFQDKSPATLAEKGSKIWEKHGDELRTLWEEVVQHTWKIENKTGWFSPSLSNLPVISPDKEVAGEF